MGAACRICGCTQEQACEGGCWWVIDPFGLGALCSTCLPVARADGVAAAIREYRFRFANEEQLQEGLASALAAGGLQAEREVRLDARSRIDLLVERVGVEVKVNGRVGAVSRQIGRYARSELVDAIVVVTNRAGHLQLPGVVEGKPVRVVTLAGAGL